jgi:nicotinamidase-related amidase
MTASKNNSKTALLVMDIQETMMTFLPDPKPLLAQVKEAIDGARAANIEVIYVILSFRKGHPEISSRHKRFSRIKDSGFMFTEGHEGTALHSTIVPKEEELILHKKRVSAFAGSDLEMVLKSKDVDNLVIAGFATSGIVLHTVTEGSDKDYHITVLSDACADPDPEIHEFLTRRLFQASCTVMTTDHWVGSIRKVDPSGIDETLL